MKSPSLRAPALCLGLLALTACGNQQQGQPKMPPPQVGVVTVQPGSVPLTKDLVGRLSAFRSADVLARVSGLLLKRVYTEGSDVKQGQLMFQIDPAPYQATLDSALGNLASAKATYTNAHVVAERDRSLIPMGYISRAQLDADEAAERSAAAGVQQAQASVQNARINLGYTKVTAPIDGRSGEQQVTEGAIVGNGTADAGANSTLLTTVQQLDPLYVNFTMSAADLTALQRAETAGQVALSAPDKTTMQVSLPDGSRYNQPGTLDFSAAVVNATTGAVNLRGVLPNPQHQLLPGTYVTLAIDLGQQHGVFLVPQQALQRDVAGAYLLVVDKDGKAQRKNVVADNNQGNQWIVTSGLAAGDQVIVSGLQGGSPMGVQPGMPVQPSPWQPNGAAQAGQQPPSTAAKS
jgi:membrane fusion protein (multidrug efflux system)